MGKKWESGSGMKPFFWVKTLKFFDADPGWKKFGYGIEKMDQG
jgi:hypothetical protein